MNARWIPADTPPPLPVGAVHVWHVGVDAARAARCAPLLDTAERQRAAAFHFAADRERYTIGRGLLRQWLAAYLQQPAATFEFSLGPAGKPRLASAAATPEVEFNISHSGAAVLLAFARNHALGVDVEAHRPGVEFVDLATRFFAPDEAAHVRAAAPAALAATFYAIWTRKEACVKALGSGLSLELRSFSVLPLTPEPRSLPLPAETGSPTLTLVSLPELAGHHAALAVASPAPLRLSTFTASA